jgi:DNA-binding response OmpR family regulator
LADLPGQQQAILSVIENLGWEFVVLTAWPPVETAAGDLDLLVLSVSRIRQAALATISDAALNPQLSILVVSEGRNPQTIADVLRSGAHDYLVSSFAPLELEARMVALVTRVWPTSDRRSQNGISFDFASRTIVAGPYHVTFTPLEWDVLIALLERDGQPMATKQVVAELSHRDVKPSNITAVVSRIRRKLERNNFRALTIDTVQRRGYGARFRRSSDQGTRAIDANESDGHTGMAPLSAAVTCQVQGSHFGHKSLLR